MPPSHSARVCGRRVDRVTVDDEFIETYNIKALYIDKLTDNVINMANFKTFLNNYPTIFKENDIPNLNLIKHVNNIYLLNNLIENTNISNKKLETILLENYAGFENLILYEKLDIYIQKLRDKLIYYQQEYEKYINYIGFELNDRTYDETLFNLLNNGIVLD